MHKIPDEIEIYSRPSRFSCRVSSLFLYEFKPSETLAAGYKWLRAAITFNTTVAATSFSFFMCAGETNELCEAKHSRY